MTMQAMKTALLPDVVEAVLLAPVVDRKGDQVIGVEVGGGLAASR